MIVKVTLSLPDKVLQVIDHDRGDVARSRYVMRLIEKAYHLREEEPQQGAQVGSHRRPAAAAIVEATDNLGQGGSSRSNV